MVDVAEGAPKRAAPRRKPAAPAAAAGTATSLRGRIPSLQPAQAEALRAFHSAGQRWFLDDGGLVRFAPGDAGAPGEAIELDADGTPLAVRFTRVEAAHSREGLRWSDQSGRTRLLAWGLAHEAPLRRLSEVLGTALLPMLDPVPGADTDGDPLWLAFSIEDELPEDAPDDAVPPTTTGALRLPRAWLQRLLERAEPPHPEDAPVPLGAWTALRAPVRVLMTLPPLTTESWSRLRPGDVLVLGARGRLPKLEAQAAGRAWPLASVPGGWRVDAAARPLIAFQETPMSDATAAPEAPTDAEAATRQLPVRVEFQIGEVEMTLGDLAQLQPGYVFTLPANLEGANVTVRANGRVAGRGEVVAVGDTLGVRLLSWS